MYKGLGDYLRWGSFGIAWVSATAVYLFLGIWGGRWLDERLETSPAFFLIGLFVGLFASVSMLFREVFRFIRSGERQNASSSGRDRDRDNFPERKD